MEVSLHVLWIYLVNKNIGGGIILPIKSSSVNKESQEPHGFAGFLVRSREYKK